MTLGNTGDQALAGIGLTTTASPSSKLDTDPTMGLQLQIDACSVPWTEAGAAPRLHLHLHRHQVGRAGVASGDRQHREPWAPSTR